MKKLKILVVLLAISLGVIAQNDNCLDFNGVDDYLLGGDESDLGSNDFTIEAWVNCESTGGIGQFVICKGITAVGQPSNAGYGLRINDQNNNDVDFFIGSSTAEVKVISSVSLSLNNWHHIAGVRSGIYMSLYVDGNLVAFDSTSTVFDVNTNIPLSIGAHDKGGFSTTAEFMNGKIDEVRIWSTAKTVNEINDNKDCAITSPEDNLLAVYNLNEGGGSIAVDSSGFNNDCTIIGSPIWIASSVAPICSTVGIGDIISSPNIELFPNPFISNVEIKNGPIKGKYVLYKISGELIVSGTFSDSNISLINVPNGMYILEISSENLVWRKRIVKQNGY